jgi:hypothetical protein
VSEGSFDVLRSIVIVIRRACYSNRGRIGHLSMLGRRSTSIGTDPPYRFRVALASPVLAYTRDMADRHPSIEV